MTDSTMFINITEIHLKAQLTQPPILNLFSFKINKLDLKYGVMNLT